MADRYFVPAPIDTDHVTLDGAEAHHLIHVMRAKPGLRVTLFDGSGVEFAAVVEQLGRDQVDLAVTAREEADRELPFLLTLGVALPKGERQKWLVEKATELGVGRIVPLRCERGVAQPVQQALERLRRTVVEASKQCGRNRLMEIAEPQNWDDFVESTQGVPYRLLAHPVEEQKDALATRREPQAAQPTEPSAPADAPSEVADASPTPLDEIVVAIGPEGGFAADEIALAGRGGWQRLDLGPRILRVETAVVFVAATVISQREALLTAFARLPARGLLAY
jgi:16S rRNA (uracil1498-N3)-methyltransferase